MLPVESYVFSLCFAGHVVGDFVLQTEEIARDKRRSARVLTWHVVQHVVATGVLLFWGWTRVARAAPGAFPSLNELATVLVAVGLTHFAVDRFKIFLDDRYGGRASFFVFDQGVHLAVLVACMAWLRQRHGEWSLSPDLPTFVLGQPVTVASLAGWILLVAGLVLVMRGGAILSWIVTSPLVRNRSDQELHELAVAREPLAPSRDLFLGYAERAGGLLLLGAVSVWAPILLFAVLAGLLLVSGRGPGRSSLRFRYRSRQLAVNALTVAVVGAGILFASAS